MQQQSGSRSQFRQAQISFRKPKRNHPVGEEKFIPALWAPSRRSLGKSYGYATFESRKGGKTTRQVGGVGDDDDGDDDNGWNKERKESDGCVTVKPLLLLPWRVGFGANYKAPEKENFHVRLQIDVLEQAFGPRMAGAPSLAQPSRRNGISSQNSSVSARQRGGSTSVGTGSRVPLEVKPDAYNSGVDEEKLYSDVIQNLQRAPRAENQDEADNAVRVDDDVVGEDEDLEAVEWDPLNPHMEEDIVLHP
ncbi:hypothetical protein D1007_61063 [Hordeum vulgare]|nr:hypothetical protein D1007_61063 [Hordeum vulgare]